ncbi:MAG: alpha-L-arabinofuranosidase [Bacteroidaceae bacterium]|nr:alpha-L-arabinofuranosidase [Bacteroidaceae bacterium]
MRKMKLLMCAMAVFSVSMQATWAQTGKRMSNEPDSVYLLSYATQKSKGQNGLHFAYSIDGNNWLSVGNERSFLKCDYGAWGSQKRMLTPWLLQGSDGWWHCVWSVNETHSTFAHASSPNLTDWYRQSYPATIGKGCHTPVITCSEGIYTITYRSEDKAYALTTTDFKTWSTPVEKPVSRTSGNDYERINLHPFGVVEGQVQRVEWSVVDHLLKYDLYRLQKEQQNNEQVWIPELKDLKPIDATLSLRQPMVPKAISDMLIGIFFEDINYAADGGIYAELIQNRGFEYDPSDTKNRWGWSNTTAWEIKNKRAGDTLLIATDNPIHENNKHYGVFTTTHAETALANTGFDGIPLKKGEKYDLSLFVRRHGAQPYALLTARLVNDKGKVVAEKRLGTPGKEWKKLKTTLVAKEEVANATLWIGMDKAGVVELDMVSLFPQKTFKGRKNGMRADLAQVLADMKPRFVRFPGGCASHGDGIDNIYRWVNTIGPLEARKPMRNIWNYHQSMGLGFFEYFQFCEDIGAEPLPVLAAGVPCQNSSIGGAGQQGGIPMDEMDEYVDEILALIEWANGDPKESKWAKMRAEAGHPKPFNLKYLGIGNEDLITNVFEERFVMIYNAVREKYPEITVIGTVGPFYEGSDYEEGWDLASRYKVPMVDEHYYNTPGWFLNNQQFYDHYDRSKSKVYLGEYATHLPRRPSNLETALCDALHLTNVERNADVVTMTSYAPLLAKEKHTQWNPDMIYFNNHRVRLTVEYYVQKLFAHNTGTQYLPAQLDVKEPVSQAVRKRISYSIVKDEHTGDIIVKVVNLLPTTIHADIDLSGLGETLPATAQHTLLTGELKDTKVVPQTTTINLEGTTVKQELPAYSLTIIRL